MANTQSVATLIDSTTSKIHQLHQAFAELESHSAISLNLKWKELEEHFHGLERSLKKRFVELEYQENEYVTQLKETQEMLEKQEAAVVAKELASLDKLQEKRDSALSALFDKYSVCSLKPIAVGEGVTIGMAENVLIENSYVTPAISSSDVFSTENGNECSEHPSELVNLCKEMDAEGLLKFVSDNRKNLNSIREEVPFALKNAPSPFILVLDSLKGFYAGEILGSKKDGNLLGQRRTCLMLMESLKQLADAMQGSLSDKQLLTPDIKEEAKVIAKEWKPKLDHLDIEAIYGNSLEAHAFLQLLATFDIISEFEQNEICKLIPAVTRRRQTVDLCRSLGLSHKMPGLIEVLQNTGRQIEAVNLAFAFELTEQFAPVPLLKGYLKEARKVSQVKAGSMSPGAQNEINERELSALRVVIKCIEEHKLEEQYPIEPLQKRIIQLEKAKADKRRAAEAAKPQSKRPRAGGSIYNPRVTSMPDKSFYRAPSDRFMQPFDSPERFPYPYDRQYIYATENHHPTVLGSAPYTISPTHTPYYGNAYQGGFVYKKGDGDTGNWSNEQRDGSFPSASSEESDLQLPIQTRSLVEDSATAAVSEYKSIPDIDYLMELLTIQQQGPRSIGFFGTRNMGFMHQQLIEILSYAMVITKNRIFTSGASGTDAAVIRGALRAEKPELLTVILPQSLKMQPPESQELLSKVQNLIEMPNNDHLPLIEASRLCNMDILSKVQQVICFAFHDSRLLLETCQEAKRLRKLVTLFYLD